MNLSIIRSYWWGPSHCRRNPQPEDPLLPLSQDMSSNAAVIRAAVPQPASAAFKYFFLLDIFLFSIPVNPHKNSSIKPNKGTDVPFFLLLRLYDCDGSCGEGNVNLGVSSPDPSATSDFQGWRRPPRPALKGPTPSNNS